MNMSDWVSPGQNYYRLCVVSILLVCLSVLTFDHIPGSHLTRLREARRLQRLQRLASPTTSEEATPAPCPQTANKTAQNRVILELAWKTVALMHKNRLIQQKIIALQKETSEFIATVMNHPENRKRYMEHMRMYGLRPESEMQQSESADDDAMKMEPDA